jgi:hypothetical protein
MYWPDTNTGVDIEPARKPVASLVRKYFTEGGAGQATTVPGGDFFNQLTNEILNVVLAAGLSPSKTEDDQLLTAMERLFRNGSSGFDFSDVENMKSLTPTGSSSALSIDILSTEQIARTMSYHGGWASMMEPRGGAAYMLTTLSSVRAVRGSTWTPDGHVDHFLDVGDGATYVAVIAVKDTIAIEQAGAKPGGVEFDCYPAIQAAFDWASSAHGRARHVTAGVGDFYFSRTILIESLQPDAGLCPGLIGTGWLRTNLIKTTNDPVPGAEDYSVDAHFAYKTRHPTDPLYCYNSEMKYFTCKSVAEDLHQYAVYGKRVAHFDWAGVEFQHAVTGIYAFDAWMMRWDGVTVSDCDYPFLIDGNGTTLGWKNVWAHNCRHGAYDIRGVVYSEWSNCGADNIFDPANPLVNKIPYKFTNCQGINLSGCGAENCGEVIKIDNSIVNATAFRVNSIRAGEAGQTLVRAVNGAGGVFDSCGFTSVPATSSIKVQSKDDTSFLSFRNCAFQIANSGVPNDSATRRNGLTTNMPLDVMGLKTVRVAMNGAAWKSLTPLKANCGFMILSGVADSADRYITLTKPFWAYSEISTDPNSPTTIGSLANAAGVSQTSLRASRIVDAYGVEMLQINFSGTSVTATIIFTLQTAQHW